MHASSFRDKSTIISISASRQLAFSRYVCVTEGIRNIASASRATLAPAAIVLALATNRQVYGTLHVKKVADFSHGKLLLTIELAEG